MKSKNFDAGANDVTDIYSAILSSDPADIADALFSRSSASPDSDDAFIEERRNAASLRISKIMWLVASLQPELESCSEEPIKPWASQDIARLRDRSWPNILGMRVVIPSKATQGQRAQMMCSLLEGMAKAI